MQYTADATTERASVSVARDERRAAFLRGLGASVRQRRNECGLTLRALAQIADVSERFLVQLEAGEGNISVARLQDVAEALQTTASVLLAKAEGGHPPPRRIVALLGLRGSGKSSVGTLVAEQVGVPFVELDAMVASAAGMSLSTLFEIHGDTYFRRLEREALRKVLGQGTVAILATGGSIVNDPETFALLKKHTCTIWLKASPEDHWNRVVAQGDVRPMAKRHNAMSELRLLLRARSSLYSDAEHVVDTSGLTLADVTRQVLAAIDRDRTETGSASSPATRSGPRSNAPAATAKGARKTPTTKPTKSVIATKKTGNR